MSSSARGLEGVSASPSADLDRQAAERLVAQNGDLWALLGVVLEGGTSMSLMQLPWLRSLGRRWIKVCQCIALKVHLLGCLGAL